MVSTAAGTGPESAVVASAGLDVDRVDTSGEVFVVLRTPTA